MNITFALIMGQLRPDQVFLLANQRPVGANYLFGALLPDRNMTTYDVKTGRLTVKTVMAGMVGMSSPYPEGTAISYSDFKENTAKIAQAVHLEEADIREVQALVQQLQLRNEDPVGLLTSTALNLYEKGVLQALDDTKEYLRARAIMTGQLNWEFNKKILSVNYGLPSANVFTERTADEGYGGTDSRFWEDDRAARSILKNGIRARICSMDTLEMIINNPANKIVVTNEETSDDGLIRRVTIRKAVMNAEGITVGFSQDARDSTTLIGYGRTGNILDATTPGATIEVDFVPDGVIAYVGNNVTTPLVTEGTPQPQNALGYTHIAPTVEGGNRPGQWGRIYVPENTPWAVRAEGVANVLPVIEAPEKIVLLKTAMV